MRIPARRALIAAIVTALALPSAASASCLPVCTGDVRDAVETTLCPPVCLDEVWARMYELLAEHEGDGSGALCAYAKLSDPPPPGWSGGSGGAPYVWLETKKWGKENEGHYDLQLCIPGCEFVDIMPEEPDLSGPPSLTAVRDAATCAVPTLP